MRKTAFLYLLLTLSSNILSQPTLRYYNYKWEETIPKYGAFYSITNQTDTTFQREDYFVATKKLQMSGAYSNATEKVKIGKFYWFHSNGQLERVGNYLNGKRDGVWLSYYENGIMEDSSFYENDKIVSSFFSWYKNGYQRDSITRINDSSTVSISWFDMGGVSGAGRFLNEKKSGKWNYYHRSGTKSSAEIYYNGILKSKTYFSENSEIVDTTKFADKSSTFKNGKEDWINYMSNSLYYPANLKLENTDKIVVVVIFDIDEDGKVVNARVKTPFHFEYDKIALDVINKSPKWKPAFLNNRYFISSFQQAVFFSERED